MNNSTTDLDHLILRITIWAEMQAQLVLKNGRPLDERGIQLADLAGVQYPAEVSLLTVSKLPTAEEADLS